MPAGRLQRARGCNIHAQRSANCSAPDDDTDPAAFCDCLANHYAD